jgi:hypothetical protein
MRKLQRFLAILSFSLSELSASLIGNPSSPAVLQEGWWIPDTCWSSLRIGVAGDFLLSKRMRPCHRSAHRGLSHAQLNWQVTAVDVGWDIRERFDLDLFLGPAPEVELHWKKGRADGNGGIFWGGSAKLILVEIEDTTLGLDVHGGGTYGIAGMLSDQQFDARLRFWQAALGCSQNFRLFKPYVGAAFNHLFMIVHPKKSKKLRFHDVLAIGMYEGFSFNLGTRVFLNFEARQFFETGLSVSGEMRF